MLTIRLSRIGKTKKPMYRLIISEKTRDPYGRALEILGSYNPYTKELQAKNDRINYWIKNGAGMSATVNNLLIDKKVIEGEKVKASIARKKKKGGGEESAPAAPAATSTEAPKAEEATPQVEDKPAEAPVEEKKEPADAESSGEVKEAPATEEKSADAQGSGETKPAEEETK